MTISELAKHLNYNDIYQYHRALHNEEWNIDVYKCNRTNKLVPLLIDFDYKKEHIEFICNKFEISIPSSITDK